SAPTTQSAQSARTKAKPRTEPVVGQSSAPQKAARTVTVAAGTTIPAELETPVATDKNHVGDPVVLQTTRAVEVDGVVVIPTGSTVRGTVTGLKAAGRMRGASELTIRFTEIAVAGGRSYPVTCEAFRTVEKGDGKQSAAEIGGAAAVGGVLGGVLGGKHDVLKGAAIGAAVGTGVAAAKKGTQISLPAGTSITVQLTAPIVVSDVES